MDACGRVWTGGGGPAPCGRSHRNLKLESTDVILSSSQAKKLASFYQNFVFGQKKSENVSAIEISGINYSKYSLSKLESYSRI